MFCLKIFVMYGVNHFHSWSCLLVGQCLDPEDGKYNSKRGSATLTIEYASQELRSCPLFVLVFVLNEGD